ncbi:hypothetical protein SPSIL_034050 [Sporomusa silvacetica DSM 10669]|uniref:Membrane protein FdrA n=1 Tax=Sporomusa silvacetica DSM 10669 TaxID=1123289 RepID=A0ABZ3INB7_9FIRM|nr:DUF1116 domain-containing protein [Sporomusa silvacetica]OZC14703.1 membrane protein FdrA [Sporomusa silvacetica DSM 10669]
MSNNLLNQKLNVVNVGLELFSQTLVKQAVPTTHVSWRPPAGGNKEVAKILDKYEDRINAANEKVVQIYNDAQPVLTGVKPAHTVLKGLTKETILHAGPPIEWDDMCGPMKGAILGAIRFEGLAENDEKAVQLIKSGNIKLSPNHHHGSVGPMTGMITYHMPVFEVKNETFGNVAYCSINEGLGKVMRFGANDPEVLERLIWFRDSLGPAISDAIALCGGINLKVIMAQALAMGDEMHQRNIAASSLFARKICPLIAQLPMDNEAKTKAIKFICDNDQFFLNMAMAAAKSITDPAKGVKDSSIVTVMCRNGTEFGVKVAATGEQWFTAPANMPEGLYFPGYGPQDANPDMGDSAILEVIGLGGIAMAASPAVVRFVGAGSQDDAVRYTKEMGVISHGKSTQFLLATMNFEGSPLGIDIRKVIENDIVPVINTGMAHRLPGIGQIGAGVVKAPHGCFEKALVAFAETLTD